MTSAMPRPIPLTVNVTGIPDVLKAERRWATWRYELRDDRWTKMQYRHSGGGAKSNDATTWCDFGTALAAYRTSSLDGISFALGDGWAGIDVDNFRGPLDPSFTGYRETSPGGAGIKVIGRAARIGGEIKFDNHGGKCCTAWTSGRFFTITGQDSTGDPATDISAVIDQHFPITSTPSADREGYQLAADLSDDELLLQMVGTDVIGDKILALWRGDTSAYGGDHSRADQALCCHLAFWTNYDTERIDRLFRQSGLMRPKWDTHSYRQATLRKVMQ
jgi:primase-polymerase (primpol)-like protein